MSTRRDSGSRADRQAPAQIYVRATGHRRRWGLRLFLVLLVLCAIGGGLWLALAEGRGSTRDHAGSAPQPTQVRVLRGRVVVLNASPDRLRQLGSRELKRFLRRRMAPGRRTERVGAARITYEIDRPRLVRRVRAAIRAGGADVHLPEREVAAQTTLPILQQALRNNCETAALSMLLAAKSVKAGQLSLQRQLPRSIPLDPAVTADGTTWGDPRRGFVGRPDGGGPAGGFGVYQAPIKQLASKRGVRLRDLSGGRPQTIYRSLLQGRPVIAWVGLSDGPYKTWRTRDGMRVVGNLGEHTVVLTGLAGDRVALNDPLSGRRLSWSRSQFEAMWRGLGRRALSV